MARVVVVASVAVAALVTRLAALHKGLIYPDGYQYLLMARGIAAHLQPNVRLGVGGALFVPSLDASLKPLFPALVAALQWVAGPRAAADAVTVASGAADVVLCGLVARRLAGSVQAGLVAATAALVSPALLNWGGFAGPDALAPALALGALLLALHHRPVPAGIAGALCVSARPEWLLVLAPAALSVLLVPARRAAAGSSLIAAAFTLAAVLALLRPPLAPPPGGIGLLAAGLAGSTVVQVLAARVARTRRSATAAAAVGIAVIAATVASGRVGGLGSLWREQWALLALAAAGTMTACAGGGARARAALSLLGAVVVLGAVYAYRNAGSERYFAQLVAPACVAAGWLAAAPRRSLPGLRPRRQPAAAARAAMPAAVLLAGSVLAPAQAPLAADSFQTVARNISAARDRTLVTAAPDAYGFLLPQRRVRPLRPGEHGLIVLDGAQRAYSPGLTARGTLIARFPQPDGFRRPDGTLDYAPVIVVRGVVVSAQPAR